MKTDFWILWTLAWCKRNAVDAASPQQSCPSADSSLMIAVSFLYLACGCVSSVGMMQAGCTQSTTIGHCLEEIWLSRNRHWLGGNRRKNMEGAIALTLAQGKAWDQQGSWVEGERDEAQAKVSYRHGSQILTHWGVMGPRRAQQVASIQSLQRKQSPRGAVCGVSDTGSKRRENKPIGVNGRGGLLKCRRLHLFETRFQFTAHANLELTM